MRVAGAQIEETIGLHGVPGFEGQMIDDQHDVY